MAPKEPGGKPPSTEEQILATLAQMNATLRAIQQDMADVANFAREMRAARNSQLQAMQNLDRLRRP